MLSLSKIGAVRVIVLLMTSCVFSSWNAFGEMHEIPVSIVQTALSESTPTGIPPAPFKITDFKTEWVGTAPNGVELELGSKSLEWVRVSDLFLVPRGHLVIRIKNADFGEILYSGFTTPLNLDSRNKDSLISTIPVALIGTDAKPIQIRFQRGGTWFEGKIRIKTQVQNPNIQTRLFVDATCSPYGVQVQAKEKQGDYFGYVSCRLIRTEGPRYRTSVLELYMLLDGISRDEMSFSGSKPDVQQPGLWIFRLRSQPGQYSLKLAKNEYQLRYFIPEQVHFFNLGLGIGPYTYDFTAPGTNVKTITALGTLYASYFLSETVRLVAFDATPIHHNTFTDMGFYVNSESVKTYDNRISVNIMLGGHALWYRFRDDAHFNFGFPQGFEVIYRDLMMPGYNGSLGSFILPSINGKSYYNSWLRYGARGYFAEMNYLLWTEKVGADSIFNRSLGISFGFPVAHLF